MSGVVFEEFDLARREQVGPGRRAGGRWQGTALGWIGRAAGTIEELVASAQTSCGLCTISLSRTRSTQPAPWLRAALKPSRVEWAFVGRGHISTNRAFSPTEERSHR